MFKIHVRLGLASKDICIKHKFNEETYYQLIEEIFNVYDKSQAHPGEAIGAIAA